MEDRSKVLTYLIIGLMIVAVIAFVGCKKKEAPTSEPPTPEELISAVTSALQTTCPVMGGPIVKTLFVEHKGKKVYFCCAGCETKFEANPEEYISKLPQFMN